MMRLFQILCLHGSSYLEWQGQSSHDDTCRPLGQHWNCTYLQSTSSDKDLSECKFMWVGMLSWGRGTGEGTQQRRVCYQASHHSGWWRFTPKGIIGEHMPLSYPIHRVRQWGGSVPPSPPVSHWLKLPPPPLVVPWHIRLANGWARLAWARETLQKRGAGTLSWVVEPCALVGRECRGRRGAAGACAINSVSIFPVFSLFAIYWPLPYPVNSALTTFHKLHILTFNTLCHVVQAFPLWHRSWDFKPCSAHSVFEAWS